MQTVQRYSSARAREHAERGLSLRYKALCIFFVALALYRVMA